MASSLEVAELRLRGVHWTKLYDRSAVECSAIRGSSSSWDFDDPSRSSLALEPGAPAAGAAKFDSCLCRRLSRGLSCVASSAIRRGPRYPNARSSTVHWVEMSRPHYPIVEDIGCDKQTRWFGNPAPFKPLLGTTRQLVGQGGCRHLEVVNGASARPQPPIVAVLASSSSSDQGAPARGSVAPRARQPCPCPQARQASPSR